MAGEQARRADPSLSVDTRRRVASDALWAHYDALIFMMRFHLPFTHEFQSALGELRAAFDTIDKLINQIE